MKWERVLTVNDFYDSPRLGVAEVDGTPHIYQAEFDEQADEYSETYLVSPVEPELLALILEDWDIWLRFHAAWEIGAVSQDEHPALPEDRARHEAIERVIGDRLRADAQTARRMRAQFKKDADQGRWMGMTVCWSPASP